VREGPGIALHAQQFEQFKGPASALSSGQRLEPEGHVIEHREMREQRRVLEGQSDIALLRRHMGAPGVPHRLAPQLHTSVLHPLEPRGDPQQSGLTAARGPQQADDLAGLDVEGDVLHGQVLLVGMADLVHGENGCHGKVVVDWKHRLASHLR